MMISKAFEEEFYYEGSDLGFNYSREKTTFRVWAPLAEKVTLVTFKDGDIDSDIKGRPYVMQKDIKGTWVLTLDGDQKGIFYTYKVINYGVESEAGDPYAKAVGINGDRSAVVDLSSTNPEGWEKDKRPFSGCLQDAVIYELHIRDLSMDMDSCIKNKGKYIQFTEEGTRGPMGVTTGIDHIKELGVTHVHILPTYDFATIDEKTLERNDFNWGYDPKNFNVPEGSYSTDPHKPEIRIKEYKQMIQALHKNGIGVIFDAVYNHMYDGGASNFQKIVPDYYYRMYGEGSYCNGSGCGNETASERRMYRKYMVDSVKYWASEYHIDGFRFDLMGLHDIETMNEIRKALDEINPNIITFGEGWDLGNLPRDMRAIQPLAGKMPFIGFFNDNFRDNIKGNWSDAWGHGFVDGAKNFELEIMQGMAGSFELNYAVKDYNDQPGQSINYVANHDNYTLWDKLKAANSCTSDEELSKMHKLASSIVLLSQGVPYMHSGEEFLRTKGGDSNSFKSPDSVNALDWSRKAENLEVFDYYKGLIELRKAHPAFRLRDKESVKKHLSFISSPRNTAACIIKDNANGDIWKNILVAFNANTSQAAMNIPMADWSVVVDGKKAGVDQLMRVKGCEVDVPAISAMVMYTNDDIDIYDLFANKKIIKTRVNSEKFIVDNIEVAAEEKVFLRDDIIYLPLVNLLNIINLGLSWEWKEDGLYIKDRLDNGLIKINTAELKAEFMGRTVTSERDIISVNGKLMASRNFLEDYLGFKVLADFRRYNSDTYREDYNEPDIYIIDDRIKNLLLEEVRQLW